ncbi:hypothetical protein QW060_27825 [Myroides ceti]|uniref:Uncharacterized protein n=1 Tax=Paenimyroides ceti TaxID=395087 RepID=A0ABT8D411_9FLAO|nr:hypothetical protein [Paenimyroides ceti]MDN3710592.1 hypothetical protein [Paenimyroides ceti]
MGIDPIKPFIEKNAVNDLTTLNQWIQESIFNGGIGLFVCM